MTDSIATTSPASPSTFVVEDASVTLFGHAPSRARLELRARRPGWRFRRAVVPLAIGLVVAPIVALLPPHAPWLLIALATGGTLAWKRWKEEYTIVGFDARCPRCDTELALDSGQRLRVPHSLTCDACRHELVLEVDPEALEPGRHDRD